MSDPSILVFESHGRIVEGRIQATSVLDAMNVARFGAEAIGFIKTHAGVNLLLDFTQVDYLSSAVLTELLRIHETIKTVNGSLRLCGMNPDIQKVFEITNLNKVFTLYGSRKDAVAKYERSLDILAQEDAWENISKES
ncbi:MAG TPA: STAS domain-containing protein [Candidatus Hydrogenedentes bacterium]|nr:STAS domain-containing protein [Candidatus Hydrogenedentota bacterium]HOS02253.1 STAS domain-containing protein [Candidatus Hydrogenedentota bacterium]